MATNDPNKPDNVTYIDPGNKTPEEKDAPDLPQEAGGEAPAPEMTAEEAAALAQEGEKALQDIGEEKLEPPAPFDVGGEHIPDPGDGLRITGVTFIKGAAKEAEKTTEPDKEPAPSIPEAPAAEEQAPAKKGRGGRPPKADKAEKEVTEPPGKVAPATESQQKKRGGKPPKTEKTEKVSDKPRSPVSPNIKKPLPSTIKPMQSTKKTLTNGQTNSRGIILRNLIPRYAPNLRKRKRMRATKSNSPPKKQRLPQKRRPRLPPFPNSPRPAA